MLENYSKRVVLITEPLFVQLNRLLFYQGFRIKRKNSQDRQISYGVIMYIKAKLFLSQLANSITYLKCETLKLIMAIGVFLENSFVPMAMKYVVAGYVPDFILRFCIRQFCKVRLLECSEGDIQKQENRKQTLITELKESEIALSTKEANEQHYEVPSEFFHKILGPWLKYSCNYWTAETLNIKDSEELMLSMVCERAEIEDGMNILDLGCGWGSFSLFAAKSYPACHITSVSNSASQKKFILNRAEELNLTNINVITCDANRLDKDILGIPADAQGKYDRVVSIEMFEHVKNYEMLMKKLSGFLKVDGKLFIHIFCHKTYMYNFTDGWMANTFFTGGTMPSENTLLYFQNNFSLQKKWAVNGIHYKKTLDTWLETLDEAWKYGNMKELLKEAYGEGEERTWYTNWRLFHLACSELFGYKNGNEWYVSHYLFQNKKCNA